MEQCQGDKQFKSAKHDSSLQYLTQWKGLPSEKSFEDQGDEVFNCGQDSIQFPRDLEYFLGQVYGPVAPSLLCKFWSSKV